MEQPTPLLIEVGPGSVLTNLALQQGVKRPHGTVAMLGNDSGDDPAVRLLDAVGNLWRHGATVGLDAVRPLSTGPRAVLPAYPFQRRRHWLDPAPVARSDAVAANSAPRAESGSAAIIDELRVLWQRLLGVDDIPAEANFFALGGHSLLAVRLVAQVKRQLKVALELQTLIDAPTLGEMATVIERTLASNRSPST
jgi:acyl transferase domain-containing protein